MTQILSGGPHIMEQQPLEDDQNRSVFTLKEPHFDDEATLGAKPVVPLSKIAQTESRFSKRIGARLFQSPAAVGFMVVLGAAVVGLVLGLAIAGYQYRPHSPRENVSETGGKPSDSTPDSQSQAKIGSGHDIPGTSALTDKVAREVPPKDQPPVVIVNSTGFPETQSRQDESSHTEKSTIDGNVPPSKRTRQNPINEIRERRTAQTAMRHRSRYDYPDYDAPDGISNQRRYRGREIDRIRDIFMGQEP
ncbi:MAG: hypothetical protein QOH96_2262 [Blastocatellia bacterium]|nr:hypothetical protein [Blastocatellia bacterium]